jgi:hypothetical protein
MNSHVNHIQKPTKHHSYICHYELLHKMHLANGLYHVQYVSGDDERADRRCTLGGNDLSTSSVFISEGCFIFFRKMMSPFFVINLNRAVIPLAINVFWRLIQFVFAS